MFEKLKTLLTSLPGKKSASPQVQKKPPVIITIHGYGRRRKHEMDNLLLWNTNNQYEIIQFDMYDLFDELDCDWTKWVGRAKTVVATYELEERDIYLIGFSMGGVIASYLAVTSKNVKKLILIAPAFNYLHVETITTAISKGASSLFGNDKDKKVEVEIPRSFYAAFSDVVKSLKKYIQQVPCPVLILHGDEDEVIPLRSSTWAYEKIPHDQKKLIILHKGHHRLLTDALVNWECYQIIRLFLDNKILNGIPVPSAPDILDQYQKELEEKIKKQRSEEQQYDKENCGELA